MASRKKRSQRHLSQGERDKSTLHLANEDVLDMNDFPEEMKMSAKLIDIMQPWMDEVPLEKLADYASMGWNAAVDGQEQYESTDYLQGAQRTVILDAQTKELIDQLKARKTKLFPNDFHSVVRTQVVLDKDGDPRVIVASGLKPENMAKMLSNMARNAR